MQMPNKTLFLNSFISEKSLSDESGKIRIKGYASTGTKDRTGDIIEPEAWTKGGLLNYLKNPIILGFHDHSNPIGSMVNYEITPEGLQIEGEISSSVKEAQLIKEGVLKTFSVGIRIKDASYDKQKDIFYIKDLELYEISVVSVPANQDATFSLAKSLSDTEYTEFKSQFIPQEIIEPAPVMEPVVPVEEKQMSVEVSQDNTEKLLNEVEQRMLAREKSIQEALDGLRAELKEKSAELEAMSTKRMTFVDKAVPVSEKEVDRAVLLSKLLGRPLSATRSGQALLEKAAAGAHLGANLDAAYEKEFSTRLLNEIRQQLVVEPLFSNIQMNTPTMIMPINPEAGYATWVGNSYAADSDTAAPLGATPPGLGSVETAGTAQTHALKQRSITAYKLATHEYIVDEEEEDSIIPILPIVQSAIARRMARSSDKAVLRGTGAGSEPIVGIATEAAAYAGTTESFDISNGDTVTALSLQKVRRKMGLYGLNSNDVLYIVSQDAYYDLMEDPDFYTWDKFGDRSTIVTGQVGTINGSRVIVSGEFAAKAAGAACVVAVYTPNFILGNLRGLTLERDRIVMEQRNVLVATRRLGFTSLMYDTVNSVPLGVSVGKWVA